MNRSLPIAVLLLWSTLTSAQSVVQFDTVYTPPGYPDGPLDARMYIPALGNGIGAVVVHGHSLDKFDVRRWCDTLAAYGYTAMAINYPDVDYYLPDQRAAKIATEFLRRNAGRFGIHTGKVVGVGFSQGAVMYGMTMIRDNDDAFFQTDSLVDDRIDAAALFYGAYNPDTDPFINWASFWAYFANDTTLARRSVCMWNVGNITTPVVLFHGTADGLTHYRQSIELHDSLAARGRISHALIFPGQEHGFDLYSGGNAFSPAGLVAKDTLLSFLRRTVAPALMIRPGALSINFENVPAGGSRTLSLSVENIGASDLRIDGIGGNGATFALENPTSFPVMIAPRSAVAVEVSFHPTVHGLIEDTLVITSNDSLYPNLRIALRGKGIGMPTGPAQPGVMYATSSAIPEGSSFRVNRGSGVMDSIGFLGVPVLAGLAVRPSDGVVFGFAPGVHDASLYRFSPDSGYAVFAGVVAVDNLTAMAFDPSDTLYGASSSGTLYRVDVTTGLAESLGTAPSLTYSGLSVQPGSRRLWASVRHPIDSIFTLSTSTGAATFIGTTGFNALTLSLAFDPDGALYGLIDNGSGEDYLASIDTLTGAGTIVAGPLGVMNLQSIAMAADSLVSFSDEPGAAVPPEVFALDQNFPNPFNPVTTITFAIPPQAFDPGPRERGSAVLRIYDVLGRVVATPLEDTRSPGVHAVTFDASGLSSGIYFYRLTAGRYSATRRMVLLK